MNEALAKVVGQSQQTPKPRLATVILRNSLWATAGTSVVRLSNFLFVVFMARTLGETGMGQYATMAAFVDLFGVFFELGMTQYVQREIARDRTRADGLFWNLVALRALLAVPGWAIVSLMAWVAGYEPLIVIGIVIYASTFLLAAILSPLDTLLTGNERFDLSAAVGATGQVLNTLLAVTFVLLGQGVLSLVFTGLIVMPVQIGLCWWAIRHFRLAQLPFRLDPSSWRALITASLPFGLTALALTYSFKADTVLLSIFHAGAAVGWYAVAYRLIFSLQGVLSGFLVAMRPSLAREYVADPLQARGWILSSLRWLALFVLPVAIGGALLAEPIMITLYGVGFAPAALVLAILIWDVPLIMFTAFLGNVTAALGLERPAFKVYLICALANVTLNMLLIPPYGMVAAATTTIMSDGLALLLFYRLLRVQLRLNQLLPVFGRITLAAILMGFAVWLVRVWPLPLALLVGLVSYAGAICLLRIIAWPELVALVGHLRARGATRRVTASQTDGE